MDILLFVVYHINKLKYDKINVFFKELTLKNYIELSSTILTSYALPLHSQ